MYKILPILLLFFSYIFSNEKTWILKSPNDYPTIIRNGFRSDFDNRDLYYLDSFIPFVGKDDIFFFLNPKFVWDNQSAREQNYGIGIRSLLFDKKLIFGQNLYYDLKKSQNDNYFHQMGFGMEALMKKIDFRFNFYFPLSKKKFVNDDITYKFGYQSLIKTTKNNYEVPLKGVDYEIGFLIPYISNLMESRLFFQFHNFFAKNSDSINGFTSRLEIRFATFTVLSFDITKNINESLKKNISLEISIPLSFKRLSKRESFFKGYKNFFKFFKGTRDLKYRMTDSVIRDIDVVLKSQSSKPKDTIAVDGLIYVDNSYTKGNSNGSFDDPYTTVQDGIDNVFKDKWIYIRKGNAAYPERLTSVDGVTFWGSGYNGGFNGIIATDYPTITNTLGPHIADPTLILDNNNTVMGLNITKGIGVIYAADKSNINIHHNIASESLGDLGAGIVFQNNNDSIMTNLTVSNNLLFNNDNADIYFKNASNGTFENIIVDNNICSSGDGISFLNTFNGAIKNITILNNNSSNCVDTGIFFKNLADGNISNATIKNNTLFNNVNGIYILNENPNTNINNIFDFFIFNNTCKNNSQYGIAIWNDLNGNFSNMNIYNNLSQSNTYGIANVNASTGLIESKIYQNNLVNNTYAFRLWNQSSGTITADLGGGVFSSIGFNSFTNSTTYDVYNQSAFTIQAQNNWWGSSNGPNINKIFGNVNYTPFLNSNPN
jgi:hypothetical protein